MNKTWLIATACCLLSSLSFAQSNDNWKQWQWLSGTWIGEGSGNPGHGNGTFTFSFDLDNQILMRKSSTQYPEDNGRPAFTHDDLMIIYPDSARMPSKAIYFDNEGHVIHYNAAFAANSIILTSEMAGRAPVFRLTYEKLPASQVNVRFEMSTDGKLFKTYVEGVSRRKE